MVASGSHGAALPPMRGDVDASTQAARAATAATWQGGRRWSETHGASAGVDAKCAAAVSSEQ